MTMHTRTRIRAALLWVDFPAMLLFVMLFVVVFLQFFTRFVLNDSVAWSEEISRYLLIGVCYFGSLTALRKGEHIALTVVYRRSAPMNAKPMAILAEAIVVSFHMIIAVLAFRLAYVADRSMVSIELPKGIVYAAVAIALAGSTWFAVQRLLQRIGQTHDEILAELDEGETVEDTV